MACSLMKNDSWKKGESLQEKIGAFQRPINYFSCGTYYFDGELYVVEFPAGLQLYHGSGIMVEYSNEFPVGSQFYKKTPGVDIEKLAELLRQNSASTVQEAVAELKGAAPSWFGDHDVSKIYSKQNPRYSTICQDDCVLTFRLKKKAIFIVLDNDYNIYKLAHMSNLPAEDKKRLLYMYSLRQSQDPRWRPDKYFHLKYPYKMRQSFRDVDLVFTQNLCNFLGDHIYYAGYAANVFVSQGAPVFHMEMAFCNALQYLERDLDNPVDWQHTDYGRVAPVVLGFITMMKKYKTINVNWHSGDLYQHSVWTVLFCEDLLTVYSTYTQSMSQDFLKKIVTAAFLHDIGKMDRSDQKTILCRPKGGDCFYFSRPAHPQMGADFVTRVKLLKVDVGDDDLKPIDMGKLLDAFGFTTQSEVDWLALVIQLHYDFGVALDTWRNSGNLKIVTDYIQMIRDTAQAMEVEPSFNNIFAVVLVSIADILASEAYHRPEMTARNIVSQYLPFLRNMPRQYHGGTLVDKLYTPVDVLPQFSKLVLEQAFSQLNISKQVMLQK